MRLSNIDKAHVATGRRSTFFFRYFLLFSVLILCIFMENITNLYGFSIYPDEFGYWASAAQVIGCDWSDTAALGSYYSYGYCVLLTPILWFFRDGIAAYRAAAAVNVLMQCGMIGMLWGILGRLYPQDASKEKEMQLVLAVGMAVFYPPCSFYTQMTMVETLLAFLYLFICYRMILFVEKPNVSGAVLIALPVLSIYFVHMRTVGVVIAAVLMLLLYAWKNPHGRRAVIVGIVVLAAGALCGFWIKGKITATVYAAADSELLSLNDYAGRLTELKNVFSIQGLWQLFLSSVGKLYYLMIASFGLLCPAVYVCVKKTAEKVHGYIYLFCILSLAGQFAVSAIAGMNPGRLDGIIYGRYNEYLLPVFIGIGLIMVCDTKRKLFMFILSVVGLAISFGITYWNALHSGLTAMQGYFAAGISYLSDDWHYNIAVEFPRAFVMGILLMTFVMACIYVEKRFGRYAYALGMVLFMEIALTFCLHQKYTKQFNDMNYYNLKIYQYIAETEQGEEMPVAYLYGGGFPYIDLIQFAMRDRKIDIIWQQELDEFLAESEKALPREGFLIVDQGCGYLEEIERRYERCTESRAFILFQAQ